MKYPLIFIISLLFCFGCSSPQKEKGKVILTSIPPYAYFVERIAGETVKVETLVPAGANPHIYEPTLREAERAGQASIWLRVGEPFEEKIYKVLREQAPQLVTVDMLQGIPLSHGDHEHDCAGHCDGIDRHIWLSPKLAKKQADTIAQALIALYPEHTKFYEERLATFLAELDTLDKQISHLLTPHQGQAILVSHPAFGYFCRDYNMIQLSIETEGKDPLPSHVANIYQKAQQHRVKSILTQPQYNNKGAEMIAEKLHLPLVSIDPYSREYLDNLHKIAETIAHD